MANDVPAHIYLFGIAIPAFATVLVALVSTRRGKRAAASDDGFTPQESGEHAHTRDVVRENFNRLAERIDHRFDLQDAARGAARQSEQLGVSAKRLDEGNTQ